MAIIKYHVEAITRVAGDSPIAEAWEYAICNHPGKNDKIISKEKAMEIIEQQGLVKVKRNKHGVIWDKPDEPLKEQFEGWFKANGL